MKKLVYTILSIAFLASCNNLKDSKSTTKTRDTSASVNNDATTAGSPNSQVLDEESTKFLMEATSNGIMEVELGNYAKQNSKSQRVKDFGTMMVRDHTAANEEIRKLATSRDITLPAVMSEFHQQHLEQIVRKKGTEFDKAYMKMMVEDHGKDIAKFEKAFQVTDPSVKAFANKILPVLRTHRDSARAIQNSL